MKNLVFKIVSDLVTRLKNNPLDIKLLLFFSILMTLASKFLRLESNKDLYQKIIPYTGWSPGSGYLIFIVFIILYSNSIRNQQTSTLILRGFFIFSFGMTLSYGITDWNNVLLEDYINANPYLRYTSLTPIYTITLPLFWILIHSSSLLYDFYKKARAIKGII